jgi:hydrogenase nickel incorporation protein HypA/HybF
MHELSIALSIVDIAADTVKKNGGGQVEAIYLKLGALSGVVKDALLFCWEIACADSPVQGSRLVIEDVPVVVYCSDCSARRTLDSINQLVCPVCKNPTPVIENGRELELTSLEIL